MKKIAPFLIAFLFLGCVNTHSPKTTVESVGYTLKKNDFSAYLNLLSGDALRFYGSEAAFRLLQSELGKYKKLKASDPVTLDSWKDGDSYFSISAVDVIGDGDIVIKTIVNCEATRKQVYEEVCDPLRPHDCHLRWVVRVTKDCLVDKIFK